MTFVISIFETYITAAFFIFIFEIGDKTQLFIISLSTKFKKSTVIIGIFIGTVFNHLLAVFIGFFLGKVIISNPILSNVISSILFIFFGLYFLKPEKENTNSSIQSKFYPVLTVATAFFVAEMGDKTQLAAMTFASNSNFPAVVLAGTVTGMLLANVFGVMIGGVVQKKFSKKAIRDFSSSVFVFFGSFGLLKMVIWSKSLAGFAFVVSASMLCSIMATRLLSVQKYKYYQK
jgi:Ca2+/H+ antiporter, TMEM165/GDT1 family